MSAAQYRVAECLHRFTLAMAVALAGGACDTPDPDAGPSTWVVERDTVGDTVVVRTIAGSVWGRPAALVEDLAIGVLDGDDNYMFSWVQAMAPDAEGGIYVFDGQVPALRYYDQHGKYRRTLGREGSGPGEYRHGLGLAVRRDGRVILHDPRNARLNVYSPEGEPQEHWLAASRLYTSRTMVLDTVDHVYLKVLLERPQPNKRWRIGLIHLDAEGSLVDTIPDPAVVGEPDDAGGTFLPRKVWDLSPNDDMVVGVNRDYCFEIRRRGGGVVRVERATRPTAVLPEERAAHEAVHEWMRHRQGERMVSDIPPVPGTKPAYRNLAAGTDGRIWVLRHMEAVRIATDPNPRQDRPPPLGWREPVVYDVFEPDGTYLGEVSVPDHTELWVFGSDTMWGIRRGEFDEQYVVRLRLELNPVSS